MKEARGYGTIERAFSMLDTQNHRYLGNEEFAENCAREAADGGWLHVRELRTGWTVAGPRILGTFRAFEEEVQEF